MRQLSLINFHNALLSPDFLEGVRECLLSDGDFQPSRKNQNWNKTIIFVGVLLIISFSIHSVTPLQIRSTPLVTPYLWPHLRKIKFFIIDSFCLYYVIHPFSTDMMVQFMCCVPCKSLLILEF